MAFLILAGFGVWLAHERGVGLVHPARIRADRLPESVGITEYAEVTFPSQDGLALHGWYISPKNGAVIVFVHGLGANRALLLDEADWLVSHGFGALLFDLRNSGESEGDLTTLGLNEALDVQGAVDYLELEEGVDPVRVGLFGHSMGAGAVMLAAQADPRPQAILVSSGFTSIAENIEDSVQALTGLPAFPFAPLVVFFGEWEAGLKISAVKPVEAVAHIAPRPVLFVHGDKDSVIPVSNSYALYEAAGEPKQLYIIPGADHGDTFFVGGDLYRQVILDFFEHALLDR